MNRRCVVIIFLTLLILWNPYMFSWRTKLENWRVRLVGEYMEVEVTYVVVFKVGTKDAATELSHIRHYKGGAEFCPYNELRSLGICDHS
jgi:hypothetical protein